MMARKARRPKNPKSRRKMRPAGADRDDGSKSLGSGLDEIGFQPLDRRIFVVKREAPTTVIVEDPQLAVGQRGPLLK